MVFVTRKSHFNAAHRLNNPNKSEEWNKATFGKCNYPNWHGHNYTIEVTVVGNPDSETGFVIDLSVLNKVIEEKITEPCDHRNLNLDIPFLEGIIPSTENLVKAFFYELKDAVEVAASEGSILYSVALYETERNSATYCPYLTIPNIS